MNSSTQGNVDPYQAPSTAPSPHANTPPRARQVTAAPALEHGKGQGIRKAGRDYRGSWTLAKVFGTSAPLIHIYLPFFINWLGIVGLIFGGCCSNVSYNHQRLARFDPKHDAGVRLGINHQVSARFYHYPCLLSLTAGSLDGNQRAVRRTLPCFQST